MKHFQIVIVTHSLRKVIQLYFESLILEFVHALLLVLTLQDI